MLVMVKENIQHKLLDALTIINRRKRLGLKIAICGDILHSRVANQIFIFKHTGAEVNIVAQQT